MRGLLEFTGHFVWSRHGKLSSVPLWKQCVDVTIPTKLLIWATFSGTKTIVNMDVMKEQ